MTPVTQTITADNPDGTNAQGIPGNCYQAALASILELPLQDVPHIAALPGPWWITVQQWVAGRGLIDTFLGTGDTGHIEDITRHGTILGVLGSGPSPRGPFHHVVVLDTNTLDTAHDPHPSRAGLSGLDTIEVIWRPNPWSTP